MDGDVHVVVDADGLFERAYETKPERTCTSTCTSTPKGSLPRVTEAVPQRSNFAIVSNPPKLDSKARNDPGF